MNTLQILLIVIIIFILIGIFRRMIRKDITIREFWLWSLFWLVSGAVVLLPESTNTVAKFLGIGRGADLIMYLSTAFLVYAVFRIFVRIEKVERDITNIVRKSALEKKRDNDESNKVVSSKY